MGMFDYVDFECTCPKCTKKLDDFQTKYTDCMLEKVSIYDAMYFYTACSHCGIWVDCTVSEDYKSLIIEGKDKKEKVFTKVVKIEVPKVLKRYGRTYKLEE